MLDEDLRHLSGPLSNEITVNGRQHLYFGGTAYLGIPQHSGFRALFVEGLSKYGLNNGTSRNNNIQLGIYDEAEHVAAERFGAASSLITSSGYLAAQLTLKALADEGEWRYAPATHPALWRDEAPDSSGTFQEWAIKLVETINVHAANRWVLVSNALNNLYPECYDFTFLKAIKPEKQVVVLIDDSHGIGVINNGLGIYSSLPDLPNIEPVVIASMAKALGVDAGLILGRPERIAMLKQSNEFLGASPPGAAGLYAFMQAEALYREAQQRLFHHLSNLSAHLENLVDWIYDPRFPVFLSSNKKMDELLKERQILMSSFPYPDKNGEKINRLVLSSWHTASDIEKLMLVLSEIN